MPPVRLVYKGKNIEFPDQTAADGFVKAVSQQTEVDLTVDPNTAPQKGEQSFREKFNEFAPTAIPAAMVGAGNTALFGQGPRVIAGIDTALQKIGLQDEPSVLGGGYEQNLNRANDIIRDTKETNPLAYGGGSLLSILKGPGGGMGGSAKQPLGEVMKRGAAGGAVSGTQGYLGNTPTDEQSLTGAGISAGTGGVFGGLGGALIKGFDRGAQKAAEAFVRKSSVEGLRRTEQQPFGQWIRETFGKVKNTKTLFDKNTQYNNLQGLKIDETINKMGDVEIPMPKNLDVKQITNIANKLDNAGSVEDAQRLMFIERQLAEKTSLPASDAQFLKKMFGDEAFTAAAKKETKAAANLRSWQYDIKDKIVSAAKKIDPKIAKDYNLANKEFEYSTVMGKQLEKVAKQAPPRPDLSLGQLAKFFGLDNIYGPKSFSRAQPQQLDAFLDIANKVIPGAYGAGVSEVEDVTPRKDRDTTGE